MDSLKAKLQAVVNIINEMDDMELSEMSAENEMEPKKISMVAIKAKPIEKLEEDMYEEGEPEENTALDQVEDVAENEEPETEEEMDESSVLGRLRKRLQGA